jgi:hypothetical protein
LDGGIKRGTQPLLATRKILLRLLHFSHVHPSHPTLTQHAPCPNQQDFISPLDPLYVLFIYVTVSSLPPQLFTKFKKARMLNPI